MFFTGLTGSILPYVIYVAIFWAVILINTGLYFSERPFFNFNAYWEESTSNRIDNGQSIYIAEYCIADQDFYHEQYKQDYIFIVSRPILFFDTGVPHLRFLQATGVNHFRAPPVA